MVFCAIFAIKMRDYKNRQAVHLPIFTTYLKLLRLRLLPASTAKATHHPTKASAILGVRVVHRAIPESIAVCEHALHVL